MKDKDTLLGLGTGLVLFFSTITAYTLGIKHSKQLDKGIIPTLNPIKPIVGIVTQHKDIKEQDKLTSNLEDLMGATKESMLNSIVKR